MPAAAFSAGRPQALAPSVGSCLLHLRLSREVAEALVLAHRDGRGITDFLDAHEDTCRLDYGEATGLMYLQERADDMQLCQHAEPPDGPTNHRQRRGACGRHQRGPSTVTAHATTSTPTSSRAHRARTWASIATTKAARTNPVLQIHRPRSSETSAEIHTEAEATTNTLADDFLQRLENDHICEQATPTRIVETSSRGT